MTENQTTRMSNENRHIHNINRRTQNMNEEYKEYVTYLDEHKYEIDNLEKWIEEHKIELLNGFLVSHTRTNVYDIDWITENVYFRNMNRWNGIRENIVIGMLHSKLYSVLYNRYYKARQLTVDREVRVWNKEQEGYTRVVKTYHVAVELVHIRKMKVAFRFRWYSKPKTVKHSPYSLRRLYVPETYKHGNEMWECKRIETEDERDVRLGLTK